MFLGIFAIHKFIDKDYNYAYIRIMKGLTYRTGELDSKENLKIYKNIELTKGCKEVKRWTKIK